MLLLYIIGVVLLGLMSMGMGLSSEIVTFLKLTVPSQLNDLTG
ncbi:MAG: hypothetical protein ACFFBD_23620 [Candidatus Hodarchaeota archaeon]